MLGEKNAGRIASTSFHKKMCFGDNKFFNIACGEFER